MTSNLILLFQQYLIILAQSCTEDDARHALETMDPFFSFRTLSSHVEHVDSAKRVQNPERQGKTTLTIVGPC